MEFKAATCPSCGGNLQVPNDRENVICMYCGKTVIVREALKLSITVNTKNLMQLAEAALVANNNKEAYDYFTKVLESEPSNVAAWEGKGKSAGWQSTINDIRTPEMIAGFNNAIQFCPEPEKQALKERLALEANNICIAIYGLAQKHVNEFVRLDNIWPAYVQQCALIILALEAGYEYDKTNKTILMNIIHISQDNIKGLSFQGFDGSSRAVFLADEYEIGLRRKVDKYVRILKNLDPTYKEVQVTRAKAGSCYVVTATLARENHPAVLTLRQFRGAYLVRNRAGRFFIRWYEKNGPVIAAYISDSNFLKTLSRFLIVLPSAFIAKRVMNQTKKERPKG